MGRQLPNLRPPRQEVIIYEDSWPRWYTRPWVAVVAWFLLWIPVSFLFPFGPHDLPGLVIPFGFWLLAGDTPTDFVEHKLPAMVFWAVMAVVLLVRMVLLKRWGRSP